jgi:tetratricopeptide (TPR) repeat protein
MLSALRWINPLFWLRNLSQFVGYWFRSFPITKIGPALPAVLALLAIVITFLLTYASDSQWRRGLVLQQFRKAKLNRSNDEVSLLARRLLRDTPDDNSLRFEAAAATAEIALELKRDAAQQSTDATSPEGDAKPELPTGSSTNADVVQTPSAAVSPNDQSNDSDEAMNDFDFDALFGNDFAGTDAGVARDATDTSRPKEELEKERKLAQGEAAIADLTRLALDDSVGEAAVWLLEKEFSPIDWERWDEKKRDRFGKLLEVAAKEFPDNPMVSTVYADYLLIKGERDRAILEIAKLVAFQPARALQGAMLLRQAGRESQAETMIRQGAETLKKRGDEEPENAEVALVRAQFAVFLKRYQDAIELLARTAKLSDDQRLRTGMAEVFVLWSRDQEGVTNSTERFARQLTLLNRATQIAPNHPLVLTDLMSVVLQCSDDKNPKVAELREVLVQGVAPEMAHFIRGTSAMMNDDIETATLHLELAAETLEMVPAVLNNLAVAIASRDDSQLERALMLANKAIDKTPNQPYFYETRAQIFLKLKRFQESIVDFERAMTAQALRPQVHRGLSVAYGAMGQKELADRHNDLALAAEKSNAAPSAESNNKGLNINFGSRPDTAVDNNFGTEAPNGTDD